MGEIPRSSQCISWRGMLLRELVKSLLNRPLGGKQTGGVVDQLLHAHNGQISLAGCWHLATADHVAEHWTAG